MAKIDLNIALELFKNEYLGGDTFEVDVEKYTQRNIVYVKPGVYALSKKKIDRLLRIAEIQKYYQCNPVKFIEDFFQYYLFDAQAYTITMAWNCPNVLVLASRAIGKTTLGDLMLMAKGMLYCNYWTYIASGSGSQSQNTFTTLERLANDAIDTFVGSTGKIFKQELEVPNANGDGFTHANDGWRYDLYNGSHTRTLNSNVDKARGFRGNVLFDETGWLPAEMLNVYAAFAAVNKTFKTGKDGDGQILTTETLLSVPDSVPNQKFYLSSASSTDTEFYRIFRQFSKKMILGNPDYFVCSLDCEVAFHPTMHGKPLSPLLDRGMVEDALKTNPDKARREYYCEFTTDAGSNAIIRRGSIVRNSETRRPLLYNDTGDKIFVITYDPARRRDDSVIMVGELYTNQRTNQLELRLVNCINLIDIQKKNKTPLTLEKQVDILRQTIIDYNQGGDEFYSNIYGIYIDAGAGGQPEGIAELLMKDWIDHDGVFHKGLIDAEYYPSERRDYPLAVDKVHMMPPNIYKSEFYEAFIQMMDENHIKFTAEYDNRGYLMIPEEDDEYLKMKEEAYDEFEKEGYSGEALATKVEEKLSVQQVAKAKMVKLDWKEEAALAGMDLGKEQAVNMVRIPRSGSKDGFELMPEKRNTMHDDVSYTFAMQAWVLKEERRKLNKPKKKKLKDIANKCVMKTRQSRRNIHMIR